MYSLEKLTANEWSQLGVLFLEVFGHTLDPALANFKYEIGRGESLALLDEDGEIVAHCGMIFRDLLDAGIPAPGVQFGDLMVAPNVRGILSRQGLPFYQVFTGALRRVNASQIKPLVFGFPSDRATRLGERLDVIAKVDQVMELTWPKSQEPLHAVAQTEAGERFRSVLNWLWKKMAKDLGNAVVGVRDAEYFVRRYFNHPIHEYSVYLMRSSWLKRPLGVFVLRRLGPVVELVDWVAPMAGGLQVIEQARRAAAQLGGERLITWLAQSYSQKLMVGALSCQQLEICVALAGTLAVERVSQYKGRMWITSGDTDYH